MVGRVDLRYHHRSHRRLLSIEPAETAPQSPVDAVIVPGSRAVQWMREAMGLARGLDCVLLVMCSRQVKADEVADLGDELGVVAVAVDTTATDGGAPALATSDLLTGTRFERLSDASEKRNLGLLLSALAGWERVLFLDDDIYGVTPGDARTACGLLDSYDAVGLENIGFPDNSVVCHAHREVGGKQDQYVGSGGLAVRPRDCRSFFPNIYNEDWFFLVGEARPPSVAATGAMRQKAFDPFANPDRARSEEFGDCLAEGLYWLLDHHLPLEAADEVHWRDFLHRRARFIDSLLESMWLRPETKARSRRIASLTTARSTCEQIDPALCTDYLDLWRADLGTWRQLVDGLPTNLGIDRALDYLGLADRTQRSRS
jgi:hypothetical protein